ncbi:MAG: FG-GAP-like repeat-containing protein, partial [Tepidanaerobacteraceae bacterium]|nr:FG-GAP-like repeat-containing protein [Tepidanaerobacteraceae bacterium]
MRQAYQLEWASKDLGQESRVALGDVNGDGNINIIAGTTASSGQQSNLHVFQYRGQSYHQLARTSLGNNDTHWIGCHDIDKDGIDEIIVGCTTGIYVYKMRGSKLVKIAESVDIKETIICIAIADIDRDGKYEIIAVVKGKPRIFIFRYDGRLVLWKSEIIEQQVYCVAVGDTDGDGYPEVVVKTHGQRGCILYVLSFKDGKRHEKLRSHLPDADKAFLAVDDFDLDGKCEIVFDCTGRKVRVMRHIGGGYKPFWDSPPHSQSVKNIAIYDIDGDGQKELIVVCLSNVYIYSWKSGKIIQEWNQTVPNGDFCITAGELNQKGYGEIVVGTVYGYIYVFEARRERHHGKLWMGKIQAIIQDTVTIPDGKPDATRGVEAKAKFS